MNEILSRYCPRTEFDSYEDVFENYKVNVPANFNFAYDVVDEWARIKPDKKALVWTDDDANMETYTFADMKRLSDKAANVFKALGINKGDIVMLILKQRPSVWVCLTALMKIGAIAIPATFQLKPKDIVYRCDAAGIKMIVAVDEDSVLTNINSVIGKCKTVEKVMTVGDLHFDNYISYKDEMEKASDVWERPTGDEATTINDTMLVYFSSGTSGMPKMVRHQYELPLGHIVTAKYWQCVEDDKIHMTQTDSGWAKFAWGKIYGQWICGATIGAYDTMKFTPHGMLEAIQRIRPTTFCAPATIYRFLIKEDMSGYDFSFIHHASVAGEPLNPEVYNKFKQLTGLEIHEGFGQTEGSVLLANFKWIKVRPGSMGKPAPLYGIRLLDNDGVEVDEGIEGSITISTKVHPTGLFHEYWKDEEANKKSWHDGIYNTGDMAWRDSDGYYWFVGRNDDVIKCSGYRIGPFEVESALLEHPSVLECAITAAPDPMRGQVVKATIVLARGYEPSEQLTKELQNHVKRVTAPYKYPRIVEYVDELPKTTSGKIQRNVIRHMDSK